MSDLAPQTPAGRALLTMAKHGSRDLAGYYLQGETRWLAGQIEQIEAQAREQQGSEAPLVTALQEACDWLDAEADHPRPSPGQAMHALSQRLRAALSGSAPQPPTSPDSIDAAWAAVAAAMPPGWHFIQLGAFGNAWECYAQSGREETFGRAIAHERGRSGFGTTPAKALRALAAALAASQEPSTATEPRQP